MEISSVKIPSDDPQWPHQSVHIMYQLDHVIKLQHKSMIWTFSEGIFSHYNEFLTDDERWVEDEHVPI